MKIKCEAYKCEFSSGTTCIRNQQKLKEMESNRRKCKQGIWEILTKPKPEFYRIEKCNGCEIGIKLYNEAKKEGTLPVAIKKKLPKMPDGLKAVNEYKRYTSERGW